MASQPRPSLDNPACASTVTIREVILFPSLQESDELLSEEVFAAKQWEIYNSITSEQREVNVRMEVARSIFYNFNPGDRSIAQIFTDLCKTEARGRLMPQKS